MLGRRALFATGTAVIWMLAFVVLSWPRSLTSPDVLVPSGARADTYLATVPTLPPAAPSQVVEEPPTTAGPPPTAVVRRGSGRELRVGMAPQAASPALVADAHGSEIPLFSTPGQAEPDDWMDNPTWEGLPVTFLVHGRQGDWLNVQVSMRPNMATAWVRASDVTLRTVPYRVLIDVGARTLTAYNGSQAVFHASVAPGVDRTPTPTGDFFIDGMVQPPDDSGPYGPYQVSVAAFSNVLTSFGGGIGQIAIHGTNNPALIGQPASNGCVRMNNEDITRLVEIVPIGTPVRIV